MKKYSKIGLFKSNGRLFKESLSKYRSPFQRDRDRIIHSASFRRLKHKTQVFVNTEGDHYRTRITHSMEVAQIARSIARYLNLNEDLAETLSLAHDLGHTPFGHAGEEALNECMEEYGGFDHNLQTLRVVMFLENKYLKFIGLNLTIETLEGLLKHNGPVEDLALVDSLIGIKNFKNIRYHENIGDHYDITKKAISEAKQKNTPIFLEFKNYRFSGQYEGDTQLYQPQEEIDKAKQNDPIKLAKENSSKYGLNKNDLEKIINEVKEEVDKAFDFADTQPWPQPEDALEEVYVNYPVEINR